MTAGCGAPAGGFSIEGVDVAKETVIQGAVSRDGQRERKARVIARHVALIREHFREKYALIQMKKHLAWYTEGLGHATECRARIFQTRSPEEVWEVFQSYWEGSRLATTAS